jgi:serine/threonine protein kinase
VSKATREQVAIKIADVSDYDEVEALLLTSGSSDLAMPRLILHQVINDQVVIVLELLGLSIYAAMQIRGSSFPLDLVLRTTYDIAKVLQWLHKKGYVHRDVKPDNILLGRGGNSEKAYLIDYAEAKKFKRTKGEEQVGNPYFISLNVLKGGREGPKDDLESLMTSMVLLLQGTLPWMTIMELDSTRLQSLVIQQKEAISVSSLCAGLPPAFSTIFQHARNLQGLMLPDYKMIFAELKALAKLKNVELKRTTSAQLDPFGSQISIVSERSKRRNVSLVDTRRTSSVRALVETADSQQGPERKQQRHHTSGRHKKHMASGSIPTLKTHTGPKFSLAVQRLLHRPISPHNMAF